MTNRFASAPQESAKGAPPPAAKPDFKAWYIVALLSIFALVVITVLGLTIIRPNADNTSLIATVLSLAALAVPTLITLIKGAETAAAVNIYHQAVNSQMDKWIKSAEDLSALRATVQQAGVSDETAAKLAEASDRNAAKLAEELKDLKAELRRMQGTPAGQPSAAPMIVESPGQTVHLTAPAAIIVDTPPLPPVEPKPTERYDPPKRAK